MLNEIDEKYLVAYFGRQPDYYLEMNQARLRGKKYQFNIGAFFCGVFWFLYRKLFKEALIIVLLLFVLGIVEETIYSSLSTSHEIQTAVFFLSTLVFGLIYGFVGNSIYLAKAEKVIAKVLSETKEEDLRINILSKKGGTSWSPFIIILLLVILWVVVANTHI